MAAPRKLPPDFRRALQQNLLLDFFTECAYVHRAGYLSWLAAATKRETRRQRIRQAVVRLLVQRAEVAAGAGKVLERGAGDSTRRMLRPFVDDVRRSA